MKHLTIYSCALLVVTTLPLLAQRISDMERHILQELSCVTPPRPTGILQDLVKFGLINVKENIGYDSMSCWRLESEIEVVGATFVSVCAFEEDPVIRARNPDLFYRGPGTSPGQMISFGSDAPADELAAWYLDIFGPIRIHSAIHNGATGFTNLQDVSEVGCNSWMQ